MGAARQHEMDRYTPPHFPSGTKNSPYWINRFEVCDHGPHASTVDDVDKGVEVGRCLTSNFYSAPGFPGVLILLFDSYSVASLQLTCTCQLSMAFCNVTYNTTKHDVGTIHHSVITIRLSFSVTYIKMSHVTHNDAGLVLLNGRMQTLPVENHDPTSQ